MFRFSGITPTSVLITSGAAETGGGPIHGVPKLDLVSRLQALLHEGRLKIHKDLAEADTLVRELQDFRCEFTAAGHLTFNARSGKHDDLVLALAIAVWRAAGGVGWFRYYQELAAAGAQPRDVIGVDLGQSRDPTAIAIVRRVADADGPELPAVEIPLPQQPESTAEPPDLASPEYRDEVIEAESGIAAQDFERRPHGGDVRFGSTGEAVALGCPGEHVWQRNGGRAVAPQVTIERQKPHRGRGLGTCLWGGRSE
jgi:hypothetical protein